MLKSVVITEYFCNFTFDEGTVVNCEKLLSSLEVLHSYACCLEFLFSLGLFLVSDGRLLGRVGVLVPLPAPPLPVQEMLLPMVKQVVSK